MGLDSNDDFAFEDENDEVIEEEDARSRNWLRYLLIGVVIVALVCLTGALIYNIFTGEGGDQLAGTTPSPTAVPTEESAAEIDSTPTPTRVIREEPTPTPTEEPSPTVTATPTVRPVATKPKAVSQTTTITVFEPGPVEEVLKNGGFEAGFDERGVGLNWTPFKSDFINVVYSGEGGPGPYVRRGSKAQRITTSGASLGDRYTGISQQVDVIPNEPYTLELHGQIRTGFGDINQSSFGYRMQYAVAAGAIRNWQVIPAEDWVELPWDEQLLNSPNVEFLDHSARIIPTADTITLFIRTWNKWADPGEAHFTLDDVSLVGPTLVPRLVEVETTVEEAAGAEAGAFKPGEDKTTTTAGQEGLVDKGLPTTGVGENAGFIGDSRFWGAMLILVLLGLGAVYRAKWSH